MIPLRDTIPSARVPVVTYAIIIANVVVFLYEASLGHALKHFIDVYGLVPAHFRFENLLTSMFLHGGWAHLIFNMLFLYIFGDNVEDRLGHARYAAFYLLCGMAAGAAQALVNPGSRIAMVGASGAIAGVLGAYLLFFPGARIVTLVPIFFFLQVVEIPAVLFLFGWFVLQILSGMATIGAADTAGVAFFAHVGGFIAGMVLGPVLRERRPSVPTWV
jgi:membrane associated rhomboid family serine protease